MAMENTFKIGDRVRRVTPCDWPEDYGDVGKTYVVLSSGRGGIEVISGRGLACHYEFELANDNSPIRTVTRREIVPGTYGGVVIDEHQHGAPLVRFNAKADAASLRAAATLFNELADVLDENAREAA